MSELPNVAPRPPGSGPVDRTMAARLRELEVASLQRKFAQQGAFLFLSEFLPPAITAQLSAAVGAVASAVNRNCPIHCAGGSSRGDARRALAAASSARYAGERVPLPVASGSKVG